jgi:phosphate transport system protein
MGRLVDDQITRAIASFIGRDAGKASETIFRDVEVNRLDIESDDRCIQLIALYQPTAVDLRLITTGLKITTDLERIGDNAVNICERVLTLCREPEFGPPEEMTRIAAISQSMVRDSLDAFTRGSTAIAEQVMARDNDVDGLSRQVFHELLSRMTEKPQIVPAATQMLFISKYLERIADHATNIAEMTIFMVKGRTVRHMDANRRRRSHTG